MVRCCSPPASVGQTPRIAKINETDANEGEGEDGVDFDFSDGSDVDIDDIVRTPASKYPFRVLTIAHSEIDSYFGSPAFASLVLCLRSLHVIL